MLVLRRYYQNLLGESIQLDIHQFTNCCHIIITRNNRSSRWYCLWCLGTIAFFILIISFIISFNINKIFDRIAVLFAALVLIIVLFYWRSPINQESLILLDNVSGIETTNRNIFGEKRSSFITTNHIIINEAISMHRVIYYLVAIPPSLSSILLSDSNDNNSKSDSNMRQNRLNNNLYNNNIIPLFCNTCPRLDCLKVIYQHIQLFKSTQSRSKHRGISDGKLCNSRFKSTLYNPLSIKRKNGYKTENMTSIFR